MKEPRIISLLENRAMYNAKGRDTGNTRLGDISISFYPVSRRFTWFRQGDPINKSEAITYLMEEV